MTRDVLIADDTDDMRALLRAVLTSGEFPVVAEAVDGDDALAKWIELRDRPLHAVVLDHRMPGLTGLEVARKIRAERPDQIVIICSAFLDDDELSRADAELGVPVIEKAELFTLLDHL